MIESERERGALRGTVIYPVRTARLLIRPLGEDDVDDLVAYRGRSDVCRWVPFEPMSRSEVLDRIRSAGDGQLTASGEIGYIFHPDYAGRGFATEAVRTLLDIAFGTYGLHRVTARIDTRNVASLRLAERVGMRQEAHLVENEWFKGAWSDEIDYAMLQRGWLSTRAA